MSRLWAVLWLTCLGLGLGCGPSKEELRSRAEAKALHAELAQEKQYNEDLKLRMQMTQARNKVLVDLVQGLTSDAEHPAEASDRNAAPGAAHSSLQALDKDLEALATSVQHSKHDMQALRAQREALQTELEQAKRTIEASRVEEAEATARVQAFRALLGQLAVMIEHGDLDVRVVRNQMVLHLPESVLFRSNDARVTKAGAALLDRVAEVLKAVDHREFQIAGHTDHLPIRYGAFRDNWQLSAARALRVMLYLEKCGVAAQRLSASAYADTQPIADEATPEGRQKNRRIEIVLLPNLEELPDLSRLAELLHKPEPAAN